MRYYRTFVAPDWLWGPFWPMVDTVLGGQALYPPSFRALLVRPGENFPARAA